MRITIELPEETKAIFINLVWYDEKTDTMKMTGTGATEDDIKAADGKTLRIVQEEDRNHEND